MIQENQVTVPAGIEHPAAYRRAVARKINGKILAKRKQKAEARMAEWVAEDANRIGLMVALLCLKKREPHNEFAHSLANSLDEWGCWTERQEAAVRSMLEKREARKAENQEAAETCEHIGVAGKRDDFRLTLKAKFYNDRYGTWIHKFEDANGNRVGYMGVDLEIEPGETHLIRATVKKHDVWDGVKQTRINRPVVQQNDDSRKTVDEFLATRGKNEAIKL